MTDFDSQLKTERRRALLAGAGLIGAALLPAGVKAAPATSGKFSFPRGFLWGAAVAGHQVEGQNINSDAWLLETIEPTTFAEPSGDACDHYRLFAEDIAMVAALGLNTFRFSVEWSRVEPENGMFSEAALAHYRDVLEACRKHKLTPMVSYNHFSTPRWFAALGGWEGDDAPRLFARYCAKVTEALGDLMELTTTFNEPNLAKLLFGFPGPLQQFSGNPKEKAMLARAGEVSGTGRFSAWMFGDLDKIQAGQLAAHRAAFEAIHRVKPSMKVGLTIAMADDQAAGASDDTMRRRREIAYGPWLALAESHADFVGVQCYTRARIGADAELPPPDGARLTDMRYEFYPQAIEGALRYAASRVRKPLYVTENGIATMDDRHREEYIRVAVGGVARCMRDGIDVRGYLHWSLLDNFEWNFGYGPRFGLVSVDRKTQQRTPKPSARLLGTIARQNAIAVDNR
ncbi:glycoside hydrolase family 1 protein [Pseudoduganella albidiflava]|uniref:beta-glucosidase n=1 Tax=Pseudoduganella albidiflava TaxID=321983 RepID=A0A411WXA4_9BURK|nr:family 1 glycosylhydrolase [Pseudoduganella albidiflava]QBI01212.1 glycoside hydrolase family 1 protein [Pseudoduganella albidiflava]GGY49038.1 beta-glucosidase [Pseudoduganella albidiflava]